MAINLLAVLVCAVMAMVLGFIWYGPLFGKKWMQLMGVNPADMNDPEKCKEMCKVMNWLYFIQFVLSLVQIYGLAWVLAHVVYVDFTPYCFALTIWFFFLMPMLATSSMWTGKSPKNSWLQFIIQAIYQLVLMLLATLVLTAWK